MTRRDDFLVKSEQMRVLADKAQDFVTRDSLLQISDCWRYLAATEGLAPGAPWPPFPLRPSR